LSTYQYMGRTDQEAPGYCAQDDIGGTMILRYRQTYVFDKKPPGDPALWRAVPARAEAPPPVITAADTAADTPAGG
jgi:hypothetical protein